MAAKRAVHVGIEPLERPQDTDRRTEARFARTKTGALTLKALGRDNAHREISRASQSQQRAKHGNSGERRMHGELFRLAEPQGLPEFLRWKRRASARRGGPLPQMALATDSTELAHQG